MSSPDVIVVGAGVGGLASALLLSAQGLDVLVLERAAAPGGKMRSVRLGSVPLDAGPTVFTMRWVFDDLLRRCGTSLEDIVRLTPLHALGRHAWDDREHLDLFTDVRRNEDAIGDFSGKISARGFREFCKAARDSYLSLRDTFMRAPLPSMPGLVARMGVSGLRQFMNASPMRTMWSELGRYMPDPRLRQLFGRYATYVGSSPFLAPATLMLIAHVEQDGVWSVDGGMHALARGLTDAASARGARFRFGAHVDRLLVEGGRASGVALASGERITARSIVFNGDAAALQAGLLGPDLKSALAARTGERSLSAVTWLHAAPTTGFQLIRHNVFFGSDYAAEFDAIFRHKRVPDDPTVYVCAQDRADAGDVAPNGIERLFCLINAPATGDGAGIGATTPWTPEEIHRCQSKITRRLAACGLNLLPSDHPTVTATPQDFAALFPGTGGALYGQATHGAMSSFQRPGARTRLPGLYLAGGSVHPGAGVPMTVLSARLAVDSLLQDRSSLARSRPVAMRGGTSTA